LTFKPRTGHDNAHIPQQPAMVWICWNLQEKTMGLLDGVIGNVLNNLGTDGAQAGGNSMMQLVMGLLQQQGGLGGLVEKLSQSGLSQQAASWVGSGANLPVSAEQIGQALGSGPLADLAAKFGLNPQEITGSLSQHLPEVVNQLTPEGRLPDNANDTDLLGQGLSALAGKLFG
jgi:uncharacterized protein YidB (DUF937 family)